MGKSIAGLTDAVFIFFDTLLLVQPPCGYALRNLFIGGAGAKRLKAESVIGRCLCIYR